MSDLVSDELIYCACGCGEQRPRFNKQGIERQFIKWHGRPREQHHNWRGGIKINDMGYRLIKMRSHRFARSSGYILEHRLIYEDYYKCCLLKFADIHHINGNKFDNRIENLQALSHSKHIGLTHKVDMTNRKCLRCNRTNKELQSIYKNNNWSKYKNGFLCYRCAYHWIYKKKGK